MTEMEKIFYELELHSLKWNNYFENYERHLSKFKGKNPRVLEIGVKHGGGVELLHKYFGGGKFYGIDCWVDSTEIDFAKYGIDCTMFLGDQGNPNWWDNWLKENPDLQFDIIIDDGSHIPPHQTMSITKTFDRLLDNGVYVVEDTMLSFRSDFAHTEHSFFTRFLYDMTIVQNYGFYDQPVQLNRIFKNVNDIYSINLEIGQVFINKKSRERAKTVYSDGEDKLFPKEMRTIWGILENQDIQKAVSEEESNPDNDENNTEWQF